MHPGLKAQDLGDEGEFPMDGSHLRYLSYQVASKTSLLFDHGTQLAASSLQISATKNNNQQEYCTTTSNKNTVPKCKELVLSPQNQLYLLVFPTPPGHVSNNHPRFCLKITMDL